MKKPQRELWLKLMDMDTVATPTSEVNSAAARGRPNKSRPWCWQEKEAVRSLRRAFAESNAVTSALAVYLALTEIASDRQADTFTISQLEIAQRAGCGRRTASFILGAMQDVGILTISKNLHPGTALKAESTYTLLTMRNDCPSIGNGCGSMCNGDEQPSIASLSKKNLMKNPSEESSEKGEIRPEQNTRNRNPRTI